MKGKTRLARRLESARNRGRPVAEADIPALRRVLGERANSGIVNARRRAAMKLPERFKGIEEKVGRAGVLTPMALSIIKSGGFELARGVRFREKEGRTRGPLYAGIPEITEKAVAFHYYFRPLASGVPENRLFSLEVKISEKGKIDIGVFRGVLHGPESERRFEYGHPHPPLLKGEALSAVGGDKLVEAFRKGTGLWI